MKLTGSSGMDLAADIDEKIEIKPGEHKLFQQVYLYQFLKNLKFK